MTSNLNYVEITNGSVYLLKLILRELSDSPYIKFSVLCRHLMNSQIMERRGLQDNTFAFIKELESNGYLFTMGTVGDRRHLYVVTDPIRILRQLQQAIQSVAHPLLGVGILSPELLSAVLTERGSAFILSFLSKFNLCLEIPINKLIKNEVLQPMFPSKATFMPHFLSVPREKRYWLQQPPEVYAISLCITLFPETVRFSNHFVNTLILQVMDWFVSVISEPCGSVDCVLWKGGIHLMVDSVEVVVEVEEGRRSVAILGRCGTGSRFKCDSVVYQMTNIVMDIKKECCRNMCYKVTVLDPNTLKQAIIPLATQVPCSDATRAAANLRAYCKESKHTSSKSKTFKGGDAQWLLSLSLQGQMLIFIVLCGML